MISYVSLYKQSEAKLKTYLIRDIPDELIKAIKLKAVEKDMTMKDLIISYLEEGLKREGKSHGKK
jgi:hypothetical protein